MISVTLYTKPGCGLCREVRDDLEALAAEFPLRVNEVSILDDPRLFERYQHAIPVLLIGPARLSYPFSSHDLRAALRQISTPQADPNDP